MASNPAEQANNIAQASLDESKRQYAEQQQKERDQKARAKANAVGNRVSGNMAYSNNFQTATDFTTGHQGGFSLLTAGGTESIIGSLLGTDNGTLGG